jgi:Tfp pilus assembly protein PilX
MAEKGSALPVSLMLLLVMTMLSVSALQNTFFEENMARNIEHSTIAFQAADSAVNKTLTLIREDEVLPSQARDARENEGDNPTETFQDLVLDSSEKGVTNNVEVAHAGRALPVGSCANYDCPFDAHNFLVTGTGGVQNTHASRTVLQGAQKEPYLKDTNRPFSVDPGQAQ